MHLGQVLPQRGCLEMTSWTGGEKNIDVAVKNGELESVPILA